jgi:hypothetical protein
MTGQDTDWLHVAKNRDANARPGDDGPVVAAALIAIAEELRKLNEPMNPTIVVRGVGDG